MSLVPAFTRLAPSLMRLAPVLVTFARRVPGAYDALSGNTTPATPTTWTARGSIVGNDQKGTRSTAQLAPTGQRVALRTLLVAGLNTTRPEPGDTATFAGQTYRVADVTNVGDLDGSTPPVYRVECAA
jgi:hypothetical protein